MGCVFRMGDYADYLFLHFRDFFYIGVASAANDGGTVIEMGVE